MGSLQKCKEFTEVLGVLFLKPPKPLSPQLDLVYPFLVWLHQGAERIVLGQNKFSGQPVKIWKISGIFFKKKEVRFFSILGLMWWSMPLWHLDYCNAIYVGLPLKMVRKLQLVRIWRLGWSLEFGMQNLLCRRSGGYTGYPLLLVPNSKRWWWPVKLYMAYSRKYIC